MTYYIIITLAESPNYTITGFTTHAFVLIVSYQMIEWYLDHKGRSVSSALRLS